MAFILNSFWAAPTGPDSPDDLAGLVRWYKADSFALADGTAIGGGGNEWIDQSGSGAHLTQASVGNRPVFHTNVYGSMPAVQFTFASAQRLSMPLLTLPAAATPARFTIAIVASSDNDNIVLGHSSDNMQVRFRHGSPANTVFFFAGVGVDSVAFTVPQTDLRVTNWRRVDDVGSIFFRENKTAVTSGGNDGNELRLDLVGGSTFGFYTNGYIAEICIWTQSHSDADLDSLYDNYFKPRWSLP